MKYLSEASLKKLQLFCDCADKSSGVGHPCDEMRWFDFVCQTVAEDNIVDADILEEILQDETYCGRNAVWSAQWARKLAVNYKTGSRILRYYLETR